MTRRSPLLLVSLFALLTTASAARAEVVVSVTAPENLADVLEPMPELWISNDTDAPITFDAFANVPLTYLQQQRGAAKGESEPRGLCGNGFVPVTVKPHEMASYKLWSLLNHGPGTSGVYRAVLPYRAKSHGKEIAGNAISEPFELRYGDVAPNRWNPSSRPGEVVVLGATAPNLSGTPAKELIDELLPKAQACVARAQAAFPWRPGRLPWLRGRFTLSVYHYAFQPKPALFVNTSLLGDPTVNTCLGGLLPAQDFIGAYELTFAVTQPR